MTDKEKQEFNRLYEYVKKLMGFDSNQALTREMILRLRGLSQGKYMANNNTKATAHYEFSTIYNTFVFCSPDIQKAFRTKSFSNSGHKFNYMMKIVEGSLNDVYEREKRASKTHIVEKYIDNELRQTLENGFKPEEKKEHKTTIQDDWW